ncbi:MAG: tyrosine-type recombinase/integrase [Thermoplasmata archaeon]
MWHEVPSLPPDHPTHVHPQLVRANCATHLSEQGVPVRDIMLQGDWRSLSSLRKYLREKDEARRDRLHGGLEL